MKSSPTTDQTVEPTQGLSWFERLLNTALRRYAETVDIGYLRRKYPGLPKDVIAMRRIALASRYALVAGGVSGLVISVAELGAVTAGLGTLLSAFTASPVTVPALAITVPAVLGSFAVEMSYTVRLQIRLAYDLFLFYGFPLDPNDPEDLWKVFGVAMGIKGGETIGQGVQKLLPKVAQKQARDIMRTGLVRKRFQEWVARRLSRDIARKYLAEGFLLKTLVPGLSVFMGAAWNYYTTQAIGKSIMGRIRRHGLAREIMEDVCLDEIKNPPLLLSAVMGTAGFFHENEVIVHQCLIDRIKQADPQVDIESLESKVHLDWDEIVDELATVGDEIQGRMIYECMQVMAVVDGRVSRKEQKQLKTVAELFGLPFDKVRLKAKAKRFEEPRPGRTCLMVMLLVTGLSVVLTCACLVAILVPILNRLQGG